MDKQAAAVELQHPNILTIQAPPDSAEGETLACYQARVGRLPAVQGQALAAQLLGALAYAHEQGVVHGAVDPEHLLVSRNGQLKLTGFAQGSVRPAPRKSSWTPSWKSSCKSSRYLAPEQVAGEAAQAQSDLYSAAVVIYELLTGSSPFEPNGPRGLALPVRAARAELPAALDEVFRRALARHPAERYAGAAELSAALQAALGAPLWERPADAAAAPATAAPASASRPERRHSPEVALAASGAMALPALPGARASAVELAVAAACLAAIAWAASVFARPPSPPMPAPFTAQASGAELQADPREDDAVRGIVAAPAMSMSMSMSLTPAAGAPAPAPAAVSLEPIPQAPQVEADRASPAQVEEGEPSGDDTVSSRGSRVKTRPSPAAPSRETPVRTARRAAPASILDCRQDVRIARDMCMAFRCATAEYRSHPVCVRMHAEQQRHRDVLAGTYGAP